ncbi:DNA alkylation repair protein [Hoeflea sp. WL0058]|uniref:DNA alkylation repair protein n=1 Tax=Flavimaribacter sediminis TaxID=2865987 RepID=A0AAE2ZI87_9HYPH|nr:DNA alkylation repair protein [Flavimaribacter sediminis]MBW8636404.1 DNA alkylation repair protein [Flavimaribacter sediminis]
MTQGGPSPDWTTDQILDWLEGRGSERNVAGMARYGIETSKAIGVSNAELRPFSRKITRNHQRALALWETGVREARLLACFTAEPKKMTADDARRWAADFDSWEIVDHAADLFVDAGLLDLIGEFAADDREFVRRAGFAMMAWAAVHLKKEPDETFASWTPLIRTHAEDGRNFVKKAVNWALRQIGKRSLSLHGPAVQLSEELAASEDRAQRWVGRNALKELTDPKTLERLRKKSA